MKSYIIIIVLSLFIFAGCTTKELIKDLKLPGDKGDYTLLPNGWKLTPPEVNIGIGELPMNLIFTKDEKYAITSNSGLGENSISVIDLNSKTEIQRLTIDRTWRGLCFNKDESILFVSGGYNDKVYCYTFKEGNLSLNDSLNLREGNDNIIAVTGLTYWPLKNYLMAVSMKSNSIYIYDLNKNKLIKKLLAGSECFDVIVDHRNNYAYVSLWGGAKIAVVNLEKLEIERFIKVGDHPCELLISKDDKRLFVTNANNNSVSVVDLISNSETERLNSALKPDIPFGSTPNAITFNKDESVILIANADNNYLSLFDISTPGESKNIGFIPVGWYPTSVKYLKGKDQLLVANGKGLTSMANPNGPKPGTKSLRKDEQYIGSLFKGTLSIISYPDIEQLKKYSLQVYDNTPYYYQKPPISGQSVIPVTHDDKGSTQIKHLFYIIKENRTYDQVLGDIPGGNGDTSLCLFPKSITPNTHKLVESFSLFDNFYADAEISADGHNWSTAAYASDYTEKTWPNQYGGRGGTYDYEGGKEIASPSSGYIWNRVINKGLSYRNYGEFVTSDKGIYSGALSALVPVTYEKYPGFDLRITDQYRFKIWKEDFDKLVIQDSLPAFELIRLPNDHTSGTRRGTPTINAMIADNDYALGEIVETISKSKYWKESLIFVVEDDAQNGSDHIDAHRSVLMVIGPYVKRGFIDHTMYTTSSVLKTMELVLGLKPMTQFDLSAAPILNPIMDVPDLNFFNAEKPEIDLNEKNSAGLFGGDKCEKMNLTIEDAVPEREFNEILWKTVKGEGSELPPVTRCAFLKDIK
ncbi:MAG: bifunctional YncE family protein/alkaline phosphatase family protein [Ignavibacteriaceae bacterium]|nr:bifunctional YncE family protein/alkaline phosphatase family protein [Ignavibacteriaceae bacterium]